VDKKKKKIQTEVQFGIGRGQWGRGFVANATIRYENPRKKGPHQSPKVRALKLRGMSTYRKGGSTREGRTRREKKHSSTTSNGQRGTEGEWGSKEN